MTLRKGDADGTPGLVVQTSASCTTKETISALYGSHIARELIEIEQEDSQLQIKASSADLLRGIYSSKNALFFLKHISLLSLLSLTRVKYN